MTPAVAERIKQKFQCDLLVQVLDKCVTPKQVVETLLQYSYDVTKNGREFMEANPKIKQPSDYKLYPGKMDHATCVAVQVGVKHVEPSPGTNSYSNAINATATSGAGSSSGCSGGGGGGGGSKSAAPSPAPAQQPQPGGAGAQP